MYIVKNNKYCLLFNFGYWWGGGGYWDFKNWSFGF